MNDWMKKHAHITMMGLSPSAIKKNKNSLRRWVEINGIIMLIDEYAKLGEEKLSPAFYYVQNIHNACTGGCMDGQEGTNLKEAGTRDRLGKWLVD